MQALLPKTDAKVVAQMTEMGINLIEPQKGIAARIPNNDVLRQFLRAIAAQNRLQAYEGLVPYLSFKAKPFWWLMAQKENKRAS